MNPDTKRYVCFRCMQPFTVGQHFRKVGSLPNDPVYHLICYINAQKDGSLA